MSTADKVLGLARHLELGLTGWQERFIRRTFTEPAPLPQAPVFPQTGTPGHPCK